MRLTAEQDGEAIKRYAHLRPARWRARRCACRCAGTPHTCTLERGHRGVHAAHAPFGKILAVWDTDTRAVTSPERVRRGVEIRAWSRKRRSVELLRSLWGHVSTTPVEEAALLVLFIAMVKFAIDWLLMLVG